MTRKTYYLTAGQDRRVGELAFRQSEPMSGLVRQGIDSILNDPFYRVSARRSPHHFGGKDESCLTMKGVKDA